MSEYSKIVLKNIFSIIADSNKSQNDKKCKAQYRNLLDNISINILIDTLENTNMIEAIMKLSVLERLIIVFHFILDFDLNEISVVIHATPASVYSQKSKAIKKMRSILNAA